MPVFYDKNPAQAELERGTRPYHNLSPLTLEGEMFHEEVTGASEAL
jgi:hypothetical protein